MKTVGHLWSTREPVLIIDRELELPLSCLKEKEKCRTNKK